MRAARGRPTPDLPRPWGGAAAALVALVVATTVAYARPRLGGSVTFSAVRLALPTAAHLTPVAPADAG